MAWGIVMTVFALFGMLALTIGSVTMESGYQQDSAQRRTDEAATEFKQAA